MLPSIVEVARGSVEDTACVVVNSGVVAVVVTGGGGGGTSGSIVTVCAPGGGGSFGGMTSRVPLSVLASVAPVRVKLPDVRSHISCGGASSSGGGGSVSTFCKAKEPSSIFATVMNKPPLLRLPVSGSMTNVAASFLSGTSLLKPSSSKAT